jgi:hypothetical protein
VATCSSTLWQKPPETVLIHGKYVINNLYFS